MKYHFISESETVAETFVISAKDNALVKNNRRTK